MSGTTFPNVPIAPGVPPVPRSNSSPGIGSVFAQSLLVRDAEDLLSSFFAPPWGIFDSNGDPAAVPDSFLGVEFRSDARISDYPVEQGGFETFDKVQLPFDARADFAVGSSAELRQQFLLDIDTAKNSLNLYTIVTPDAVYLSSNVVHYDYRRETRRGGASLLIVGVWFEQVRATASAQFANNTPESGSDNTNTQTPQGAAQQSGGTVQPQTPTATQSNVVGNPGGAAGGGGSGPTDLVNLSNQANPPFVQSPVVFVPPQPGIPFNPLMQAGTPVV